MTVNRTYFDAVKRLLDNARDRNAQSIPDAARLIADTIERDGIVRAFGTGHSQLLALELSDRAGGLAPMDTIVDPTSGRAENVVGYAATLVRSDQLLEGDCLICISTSGRNVAPIDMALLARARGLPVIGVTSVAFAGQGATRHPSGKRLIDVVDVVLDTAVDVGDGTVQVEGVPFAVGPASTVVGAALLNAVIVEAALLLRRRGLAVPVLASQNVDGTDEHNAAIVARYRERIRALQ